jgi:hypothetical protein
MDPKLTFFFYLGAVVCFVLAFLASGPRGGRFGRVGGGFNLIALGLALWVIPSMWDAFNRAF